VPDLCSMNLRIELSTSSIIIKLVGSAGVCFIKQQTGDGMLHCLFFCFLSLSLSKPNKQTYLFICSRTCNLTTLFYFQLYIGFKSIRKRFFLKKKSKQQRLEESSVNIIRRKVTEWARYMDR
jgi:hypothetical protein